MTIAICVGPTLRPTEVTSYLDAQVLPPVQQGDVYRIAKQNPRAIGIIDGFFDGVPSVWHKEILWAIERGIPVFGSASMGALRAAELADFGMIGVGRIFEDYVAGILQDDDEVAVLHSPAELGYLPLSVPMVSVRATVAYAETQGVISAQTGFDLISNAKQLNYKQRVWDAIIGTMRPAPETQAFTKWLPKGEIDAKADDARAMLSQMAQYLAGGPDPAKSAIRTEQTLAWTQLRERIDADTGEAHAVIDELRLRPDLYAQLRDRAALGVLAAYASERMHFEPDRNALAQQMDDHRQTAGLARRQDLMNWLKTNDLTPAQYEDMLADAARTQTAVNAQSGRLERALLTELRRAGLYTDLRDRAARKEQAGPKSTAGADRLRMILWYFETRLDRDVPDDLDSYAIALGLSGRDALHDLIEAEFYFCSNPPASGDIGS